MTQRLKIGITCYPTFGGSGVIATELGLALAEAGHEVHFITSRLPVRLQSHPLADVSFHEVNTYTYALFQHSPYDLALASKMAEVVETHELDLLHVHYAIPHAVSAHLAREMLGGGPKVVTTLHGTDITLVGNDPSLYKITRFAIEARTCSPISALRLPAICSSAFTSATLAAISSASRRIATSQ